MAEVEERDVRKLFKMWRSGDGAAGQLMAQRFSDWYYAITAVRLGDLDGREPLERACQAFAGGITGVKRSADLVDWAHGLVETAVAGKGGRIQGGDYPNVLTGQRSVVEMLRQVRPTLAPATVQLLALAYGSGTSEAELTRVAEANGGMPIAVLRARYGLKRALVEQTQIPLAVVPDSPNLDLAPLPLYEAGRMSSGSEEADFEKWLLSDINLCKDVAEFATFAHALRTGVYSESAPAQSASLAPKAAPAASPAAARSGGGLGKGLLIVGGLLFLAVVVIALVILAYFLRT